MQGAEDHHRIDLAELKLHIVKKIGAERSRRYFYYLGRFLSQKLTKVEFDKSCHRLLGRENLPLHNKLIHSILKNASLAKSPSFQKTKSLVLGKEDRPQQSGSLIPNHNPVLSNGALHKVRSGTCDRPSPLGPNGKVDTQLHQPLWREDKSSNRNKENGDVGPVAYHSSGPDSGERGGPLPYHSKGKVTAQVIRDDDVAQEERGRLVLSKNPVMAPLGIIPFSGTRRTVPASTKGDFITCYDSGGLSETEMLRKRMESIAAAQGLGGVSAECSTMLNNMLDLYLKKLVKSCVDLSGARSKPGNQSLDKPQSREKIANGMWPSNQPSEITQEQQQPVSLLDFRAAMELNPHQLGEDWPLLLEKISMQTGFGVVELMAERHVYVLQRQTRGRSVAIPASFKICEADKGIKGESFGRDNFGFEVGASENIVVPAQNLFSSRDPNNQALIERNTTRNEEKDGYLEEEVSAVVLQIGHQLFIRNHSGTYFK
uniref:Transcriptional coactivator Hfi1/Transcriptional adapter 1 n=1 Tax=Brassica oleracea TaxID=3712 RepID=A0A3P6FV10_BRAOL|nr:unnamed protein product [Brassica oleracea]